VCLDLNVWVSNVLELRMERVGTTSQQLVQTVAAGFCSIGPVQLVVSWPVLDRLGVVLQREFSVSDDAVQDIVQAIARIAEAGPDMHAPYVLLGGTRVLPLRDIEDRHVLETALAGKADVLVTSNFDDFLPPRSVVVERGELAIVRRDGHQVIIAHPRQMRRWLNAGAITLP